jgi:hypothetical protein
MEFKEISKGMVYGAELDRLIWRERDRWALWGFIAGAVITNVIWLFILSL